MPAWTLAAGGDGTRLYTVQPRCFSTDLRVPQTFQESVERRTGVLSSAPFGHKDLHTERGQCQVAGAGQGRTGSRAWRLRLRRARLPAGYLAGVTGLIAAPYTEELWRCARARKR